MNKMKPKMYKRFVAYFIDIIVVTLLSGLITVIFTDTTKYDATNKEVLEVTRQMLEDKENAEKYTERLVELNYDLTVNSVNVTIITIGVTLVYFVIMSYFCHGITLGKYIMKIKIVGNNDKELNIFNYFLRSLIINNVLSNLASIIMVYSLSKSDFIKYGDKISNIFTILLITTLILMMYREDGRGLHDLIGSTKVVDIDTEEKVETKEAIQDANIINEKKKETTKKKSTKKVGK